MTDRRLQTTDGEPALIDPLTPREQCRVLSSERRRHLLSVLRQSDDPTSLDRLATSVHEQRDRGGASARTVERVRVTLHHVDLPLLDDVGVVTYDPATRIVERVSA